MKTTSPVSRSKIPTKYTEMSFAEVVFYLGKIRTFPPKCRILPRSPLLATKSSAWSSNICTGHQFGSTAIPTIGASPFGLLDFKQQIRTINRNACISHRWYSDKSSDKSSREHDNDDDDEDENDGKKKSKRSVPSLGEDFIVWPSFFRTITNAFRVFYLRYKFDRNFSLLEFQGGAKQALQVISHKLAGADFENLDEFVDADEVSRVRAIVETMTVAQRSELAILNDDIYFLFPYDVKITEKEHDSGSQTNRVFAEVMMVFHVLRGLQKLRDANVTIPINISNSPEYSNNLWIVNYRFIKELNSANGDWTVNQIQQVKSIDEIED